MSSHAALVTFTGHTPRFLTDPGYWRKRAREAGLPPDVICSACHDTGMVPVPDYHGCIEYDVCMRCLSTWPMPELLGDDEPAF